MTRGLMYWIIVLIWVILAIAPVFGFSWQHMAQVSDGVLLILFILLGWQVYGAPVHG